MNFETFLSFLSIYSLPEEKKSFYLYFEKKISKNIFSYFLKFFPFFNILILLVLFQKKDYFFNIEEKSLLLFFFLGLVLLAVEKIRFLPTLYKTKILYEESSWFDFEVWEKPFFYLKYDRLLYQKEKRKLRELFLQVCFFFSLLLLILTF